MQRHLTTLCFTAAFLSAPALAQDLQFSGFLNQPLGQSVLSEDPVGNMLVSNLGSSGLDGVRVAIPCALGASMALELDLGTSGEAWIHSDLVQQGVNNPVQVGLHLSADGTGNGAFLLPDFLSLGFQTYNLRIIRDGQVVQLLTDLNGPTKMSNVPLQTIAEKVYVLPGDAADGASPPFPGSMLVCVVAGGSIVTPPGGNPIPADFLEFISNSLPDNMLVTQVDSIALTVDGPPQFTCLGEEMRFYGQWIGGEDYATLETLPGGKLKVSNLGSSGCDGVSVAPGGGTGEVSVELEELAAPGHNGGIIKLEGVTPGGDVDRVTIQEFQQEWHFTPDFSQLGSASYTLELYLQGQQVYSQGGMNGTAVSTAAFIRFYKRKTTHPDGTVTTEWCIGGGTSSLHTVHGGPTLLADMFVLRSEVLAPSEADIDRVLILAGDLSGDVTLRDVLSTDACVGGNYCQTSANTAGDGAVMCSSGSSSIAANDLVLSCTGLPTNQFGIFFYGPDQVQLPFGNGVRCVGGQLFRLPVLHSGAEGVFSYAFDSQNPLDPSGQVAAGQVWNFQAWYRDPAAAGASFNVSDGHAILFTP